MFGCSGDRVFGGSGVRVFGCSGWGVRVRPTSKPVRVGTPRLLNCGGAVVCAALPCHPRRRATLVLATRAMPTQEALQAERGDEATFPAADERAPRPNLPRLDTACTPGPEDSPPQGLNAGSGVLPQRDASLRCHPQLLSDRTNRASADVTSVQPLDR